MPHKSSSSEFFYQTEEQAPFKKNLIDKLRQKLRELFVTQQDEFVVRSDRAQRYYDFDRRFNFEPSYLIPLGKTDSMLYQGKERGGTNDRDINGYLDLIFPECRPENPSPAIFGGLEEAFAQGKVVVELGSGRAIALMQLAEKFQQTTFIGVDRLYRDLRKIDYSKVGLQLTRGDWDDLSFLPNQSVDTVLSVQALLLYGLNQEHDSYNIKIDEQIFQQVFSQLERIMKKGATIRCDFTLGLDKNKLLSLIDQSVWEISQNDTIFALRKR